MSLQCTAVWYTCYMKLSSRILAVISLLVFAGCNRGLSIQNTSNHDITFTHRVEGGEVSHTLNPGASLELPAGSRVRMPDFVIQDR